MATIPRSAVDRKVDYPTSDGRPMAETDTHRNLMVDLIQTLEAHYAADPAVYVSGNLLLFYEEGNKRKHISPDVFLVQGISTGTRDYYLLWIEGKPPDIVIEITSRTTRSEDIKKKMALYRDVLQVPEYFLFDPFEEYLKPSMLGYRLVNGNYELIEPVAGRLPSAVLGLELGRVGSQLRLYDPTTGQRLPTKEESLEIERAGRLQAEAGRLRAEAENDRLRREIEALRREKNGEG